MVELERPPGRILRDGNGNLNCRWSSSNLTHVMWLAGQELHERVPDPFGYPAVLVMAVFMEMLVAWYSGSGGGRLLGRSGCHWT